MAKTGPRPKPKAALVRNGSNHIYKRKDDLEVPVGRPVCPEWLGDRAKGVWDDTVEQLYLLGVISMIDAGGLALYCHAFGQFLEIESNPYKFVIITKSGAKKQNPLYEASNKAWEKVVKLSKEFGLTPSARAGLAPGGAKRPAEKSSSRFFKGPA